MNFCNWMLGSEFYPRNIQKENTVCNGCFLECSQDVLLGGEDWHRLSLVSSDEPSGVQVRALLTNHSSSSLSHLVKKGMLCYFIKLFTNLENENVVRCIHQAVLGHDVKVQLEVHLKAKLDPSLQHLGILHIQSMHSCPHVDLSLPWSQASWMAERTTLEILRKNAWLHSLTQSVAWLWLT